MKYGYKFEIIKAIEFEKKNIFSDYVNYFYDIKKYSQDYTEKFIAKLLMNSLYGRFGLNITDKTYLKIVDNNEYNIITENNLLDINHSSCMNENMLINYTSHEKYNLELNANVAISSAITSYARIEMTKYMNKNDYNLYYMDTDSIIIDKELPENLVGKEIGQMKLENIVKEGYFIGPKIYYEDLGNKFISKCKGIGNLLTKDDFIKLYNGQSVEKNKNIFIKDYKNQSVKIENRKIHIKSEIKRIKIFDNNGKWIDTKPIIFLYNKPD